MPKRGSWLVSLIALVLVAACGGNGSTSPVVAADVGITSTEIKLGTTMPITVTATAYATIGNAELAYFTYINNNGGINGRKINFIIRDDQYNPALTVPATKKLVEEDQVFAMFSGLGTQAQTSVRDYLNGKKVPQMFVATGATTFSADYKANPWTIGWQPAYQGESRIYAAAVLKNTPNAKIGVLYQNDDYGADYLKGLTDGLGSKASMIVDKESFDATATSVASQLTQIKAAGADTLFLFATPSPAIKALVTVTALGWKPTIYLNSVSNPQVYMKIAASRGAALDGVTSVGYIKDPTDPQWNSDSGMQLYQTVIKLCSTCKPEDGFNIYGVAVAWTMVDVLKQAGTNMTRKNVMDIAAKQLNESNNPFLLPGVKVQTSSNDHFPVTQEEVITYSGAAWHLQPPLIDQRGKLGK